MADKWQNLTPPASPEAEQSVLGAILVRPEVLDEICDTLFDEDFYREAHGRIFHAMMDLYGAEMPVDLVTVTQYLKDRNQLEGVGGPVFLAALSEQVGFATNAAYYASLVHNKAVLRRLIECSQEIGAACLRHHDSDSLPDFLTFAESKIFEITKSNGLRSYLDIEKAIPDICEFLKIQPPPRRIYLDPWLKEASINLFTGWRGIGKTAFSLGLLNGVSLGEGFGPWGAGHAVPCLYFDAEMPQQDMKVRCEELYDPGRQGEKLYIYSDHFCNLLGMPPANLLDEKWRRWMKEEVLLKLGIKLWVLDNIGTVTPGLDENSREAWSPINRWLLDLRFLGIGTILLHHEGKSGTQRGTSAREDNLDISISLKKPMDYRPEDGARFILHFEKARVQQKYLHLIADTEFQQVIDPEGKAGWTFSNLKAENKVRVLKMLDEGIPGKEVAELVGVSKGRVSQIKAEAIKDGLLSSKGKLTQSGFKYVQVT